MFPAWSFDGRSLASPGMRTKLALALSTLGVLGAGSAAALVNTDILDGGQATSGASAAILPPPVTVELTVPTPTPTTTAPTGTTPVTVMAPATTPAVPTSGPTGMLTTFNVGAAGTVTVDVINGALVFVGAEPAAGWTVTDTDHARDDNEVEVEFRSADTRVEFTAHFRGGSIVPEVESESLSIAPTAGSGGHDDDDGDDDDRDDDDDDDDDGHDDDRDDEDRDDEDGHDDGDD